MDENLIKMNVSMPLDENGLCGRECPECKEYFKLKFGTGLETSDHNCPYCGHFASQHDFMTGDQVEYVRSLAFREAAKLFQDTFSKSFKKLEQDTRNSLIKIKVKTSNLEVPISHYQEKDVETHIICDKCGLEFAVFGVFANCPDCKRLNAMVILKKSMEVAAKKLNLINSIPEADLKEAILKDTLISGVSTFDGFGKALKSLYPKTFPDKPRNLFQNLIQLSETLQNNLGKNLSDIIGNSEYLFLLKMFQVRHVYEHNMGVIDKDFNRKTSLSLQEGRKYTLELDEIQKFLNILTLTAERIENEVINITTTN